VSRAIPRLVEKNEGGPMGIRTRRFALSIVVLGLLGDAAHQAKASPIIYTESFTATGTLNGANFTDAFISLTATGDTSNIGTTHFGAFANPVAVSFTVAGLGSGTLTGGYIVFDQPGESRAGIASGTISAEVGEIMDTTNDAFATYDLATSIGPVSGTPLFSSNELFDTSSGSILLNSVSGDSTFSAVLSSAAVPEPSSLALCGIAGAFGLVVARRRKRVA
jgi:PEP-CTERM motif